MKTGIYSLALLLAIATIALTGIDAKAGNNIVADTTDEELLIESWMTADNFGMAPVNYLRIADHTRASQNEKLATNPFHRPFPKELNAAIFNRSEFRHFPNFLRTVREERLNIDNWMVDESLWRGAVD